MKTLGAIVSTSVLLTCLVASTSYASFLKVYNNTKCPLTVTSTGNVFESSTGELNIGKGGNGLLQVSLQTGYKKAAFNFVIHGFCSNGNISEKIGFGVLRGSHGGYSKTGEGKWTYWPTHGTGFTSCTTIVPTNNGPALIVNVFPKNSNGCP